MNTSYFCYADFETTGVDCWTCQPTQLAAVMIDPRSLEKVSEFNSLMRPYEDEEAKKYGLGIIEEKALEITNLTMEELSKAPSPKIVWNNFCEWVKSYNKKGGKWSAPILCGYNVLRYDLPIMQRLAGGHHQSKYSDKQIDELLSLCLKKDGDYKSAAKMIAKKVEPYAFGPWDDKTRSIPIFHPRDALDGLHQTFQFVYENDPEIKSISFDNMREYFGFSTVGAHRANIDVEQGSQLLCRLLKYFRAHAPRAGFKGAFKNG